MANPLKDRELDVECYLITKRIILKTFLGQIFQKHVFDQVWGTVAAVAWVLRDVAVPNCSRVKRKVISRNVLGT